MSDFQHRRQTALGKRLASYRSRFPTIKSTMCRFAILILVSTLGHRFWGSPFVWAITGVGILYFALALRRHPHFRRLVLYQNGLDYQSGKRHRTLFWNQVYEIYQQPEFSNWEEQLRGWGLAAVLGRRRLTDPDGWSYRLVQRDGRSIRLRGFESLRGLGMRIQGQIAQRQLPIAMDAFRAGYCVRFGSRLSISHHGLHFGTDLIPWNEISEISIDEASVLEVTRVGQTQACVSVACSKIPNLSVLDGILQLTQEQSDLTEVATEPLLPENDDDFEQATALLDHDDTDLLLDGFDWNDIDEVHSGQLTMDELLRRGPRHRPRRPR